MEAAEQPIPELDAKHSSFPTLYGELLLAKDYSNQDLFTTENLEERGRYFSLLEQDPETNPRQLEDLDHILTRIAFELSFRSGRITSRLVHEDVRT